MSNINGLKRQLQRQQNTLKLLGTTQRTLPKKIYNKKTGKPTKKFLKWNKDMIKKGFTTFYAGEDQFYDIKSKTFKKLKFDKRFKNEKKLIKKQKKIKFTNSTVNSALHATTNQSYSSALKNKFTQQLGFNSPKYVEVDFTKINFQDFIKLISPFATKSQILASVVGKPQVITLSLSNLNRFNKENSLFSIENFTKREGSDTQFLFQLVNQPKIRLEFSNTSTLDDEKPNGGFFKYYHNTDLDLTPYDIYTEKQKHYNHNCLYIALENAGCSVGQLNDFLIFVKNGFVPTCNLNKICDKLQIHIKLNKKYKVNNSYRNKILHFGNKNLPTIEIGLLDKHYFLIEEVKVTSFALRNYDKIKHINEWFKIWTIKKGKFEKSNKKYINSFTVIKLLLEHKETLLKDLSIEDLLSTQYHNHKIDNDDLEYNSNLCCADNELCKTDNTEFFKVFYDFETDTTGDIHKPYLMCALTQKNEAVSFIGEYCGQIFIDYLKELGRRGETKLLLIAHNARYDYTFIMDYLYCLNPLLKGNHLMGGSARLFFDDNQKIEIKFQDTLNLIPTRLAAFSKMFNIKEKKSWNSVGLKDKKTYSSREEWVKERSKLWKMKEKEGYECHAGGFLTPIKKEILPYSLYTTDNINERYIDKEVCIEQVKYQYGFQKGFTEDKVNEIIQEYLANANEWLCMKDNKIDIIEYSKKYCDMDCMVLKKGYDTFKKWIHEITELNISNYCSIASLSLDYLINEDCFEGCYKLCGRPRDFIQQMVVGGRVQTANNKKFKVEGKINDYDAVSLYPSAMARMKGFLKGKPKIIKPEHLHIDWLQKNTDGFFIKCLALTDCKIKRDICVLSYIDDNGVRQWTNETAGKIFYLDKVGYEDAIKFQQVDFKIICGYYYNEGHNDMINECIKHLFNARLKAKAEIKTKNKVFKFSLKQIKNKENKKIQEQLKKDKIDFKIGNPIQQIYKQLMNSCYGKCLLKPIDSDLAVVPTKKWEKYLGYNYNFIKSAVKLKNGYMVKKIKTINEHFNNCYAGVEILSMSKRLMNEVICLGQDHDCKIYYTDTDSIHINDDDIKKLEAIYLEKYGKVLAGKNMGQFHSDFELEGATKNIYSTKLIALGKKCYLDCLVGEDNEGNIINGYHIRMKSISSVAIHDYGLINNESINEIYEDLLEGQKKKFDLLARGRAIKFKYNPDMSVSSVNTFLRTICF
tara:strand:- start:7037 stop:10636 length:3600 start_codon:yes stop_codon:yes gene_type:complete